MTGKVMSLIAYGAFTEKMVISNTIFSNNIDMFWKTLSMVIPGSVLQSLVSDATDVRKSMPHLDTAVNHSNVLQEPHFHFQHPELVVNDFQEVPSLGIGYFPRCYVWYGELFESNLILDRKGKCKSEGKQHAMEHVNQHVNQHVMLLCIPFKYIFLMMVDTVHAGAMDNYLDNQWCIETSHLFVAWFHSRAKLSCYLQKIRKCH